MGRAMTDAIVAEAQIQAGMSVLDFACGTGEPAISIATRLQGTAPAGRVCGVDISSGPLQVARGRACERGLGNIAFVAADVHQLPFGDAIFDRATCRLGVMFFSDVPRALSEVRRVLGPGGRASLLAWGPFEQPYFETTIGTLLRLCPGTTMPATGASMFRYGQPGSLTAALRRAGFEHIQERLADVPWNWPGTPEELWDYFQEVTVPFQALLQSIPGEQRPEVNERVIAALHSRYDGKQVQFAASIVLASAMR